MDIVKELSLPPVKIHCSVLAEDAIRAAIGDWKKKQESAKPVAVEARCAGDRRRSICVRGTQGSKTALRDKLTGSALLQQRFINLEKLLPDTSRIVSEEDAGCAAWIWFFDRAAGIPRPVAHAGIQENFPGGIPDHG